jgi:putative transposase
MLTLWDHAARAAAIAGPQRTGRKVWRVRYLKIKGQRKYVYRAVDKAGKTIDFLFRAKRDKVAARCFPEKSIAQNGAPETVTFYKSGSNLAALHAVNAEREAPIQIRQVKYLNNVVEQDHRAIKRITQPTPRRKCPGGMPGFRDFHCARVVLSGIEPMHIIKKGQMKCRAETPLSPAQQFYSPISYVILFISSFLDPLILMRRSNTT